MAARSLALILFAPLLMAQDAAAVRKTIQASYDRALQALRDAKAPEDLDAINKATDTADWTSIVHDGPPQHWADVRPDAVAAIGHFGPMAIRIVKFTLSGDKAIVIARVGSPEGVNGSQFVLARDTWIKTPAGWRRKLHEKPAPGKLDGELKGQ